MILVLILPTAFHTFSRHVSSETLLLEFRDLQGFPATVSIIFQGLSIISWKMPLIIKSQDFLHFQDPYKPCITQSTLKPNGLNCTNHSSCVKPLESHEINN